MCEVLIGDGGALPVEPTPPSRLDSGGERSGTGQLVYSFKRDFIANSSKHRKAHTDRCRGCEGPQRNVECLANKTQLLTYTTHTINTTHTVTHTQKTLNN